MVNCSIHIKERIMIKIAPSIHSANFARLEEDIKDVERGGDVLPFGCDGWSFCAKYNNWPLNSRQ